MTDVTRKPASRQGNEAELAQGLASTLRSAFDVISDTAQSRGLFPFGITKINLSLTLPGGIAATIDIEGPTSGPASTSKPAATAAPEPGPHAHFAAEHAALAGGMSIDDLQLAPHARAAAQSLQDQFGGDIVFTSGRRSVQSQARAMAHNIVKTDDRQWIAKTYINGKPLQDWVDANPDVCNLRMGWRKALSQL